MEETNGIIFQVRYAGICGSDINKMKKNGFLADDTVNYGHEIVVCDSDTGQLYVVDPFICKSNCGKCDVSSLIYCEKTKRLGSGVFKSGYSGTVIIPKSNLYNVNTFKHPEIGVLCDGIAVVLHGYHQVNLKNYKKMAIIGGGSIGILAGIIAKSKYLNLMIDVFVKSNVKKEFIEQNYKGTLNVWNTDIMSEKSDNYDVAIEAVGGNQTETLTACIDIVKKDGDIVVFGAFDNECSKMQGIRKLFYKQIKMIGINSFCKDNNDFINAVEWACLHEDLLFPLLTNRYHFNRNAVDVNKVYSIILEPKFIKGYIVYE